MHPGSTIKMLRISEGLSQRSLANKLNVTQAYLSQVENGHKDPGLLLLKNAAQVLRIPVALLVINDSDIDTYAFEEIRAILSNILTARMKIAANRIENESDEET